MGYETTAIFVSSNDDFKGYCGIQATLDMGKIAYGKIAELMSNIDRHDNADLKVLEQEWKKQHEHCFINGDYTPELKAMDKGDRNIEIDKVFALENKLDKKLPCIFYQNGNMKDYTDRYGEPLMLVDLKDFRKAIIADNKELISCGAFKEPGYRRLNMAVKMIDMFKEKIWGSQPVKVILWGY